MFQTMTLSHWNEKHCDTAFACRRSDETNFSFKYNFMFFFSFSMERKCSSNEQCEMNAMLAFIVGNFFIHSKFISRPIQ